MTSLHEVALPKHTRRNHMKFLIESVSGVHLFWGDFKPNPSPINQVINYESQRYVILD